ncbi:TerC family protein, partial [Rubellimicrobium roseum]
MDATFMSWLGFAAFVGLLLAFDLGLLSRKAHVITGREALIRVGIYLALAMVFCAGVFWFQGSELALQFLSGYLIEFSLSIDNIFVIVLIFTHFAVPPQY